MRKYFSSETFIKTVHYSLIAVTITCIYKIVQYERAFVDIFGPVNWSRIENWSSYGSFIGGVGGLLISLLVLLWFMFSVQIQKKELKELRSQVSTDRAIEDCRNFLESNLSILDRHFDRRLEHEVKKKLEEILASDLEISSFSDAYYSIYELQEDDRETFDQCIGILCNDCITQIQHMTVVLELHVNAMMQWQSLLDADGKNIPNGVRYHSEMTVSQKNFLYACGMFEDGCDLLKFYRNARAQNDQLMHLSM